MNSPRRTRLSLVAMALAAALAAPAVLAAADEPEKKTQDAPLLTGPKVADRDVPGVTKSFGDAQGGAARKFANRVPPQVLNEALDGLLADDAPADIRATPEQAAKIKEVRADFQKKMREFQRDHREELQQLRRSAGEFQRPKAAKKQGEGEGAMQPDGMQPAEGSDVLAARERMKNLMEQAPKTEDAQVLIWEVLNPKQKEYLEGEIQAYRDQEEMRRAERYVQERMQKGDAPGKPGAAPPAPGQARRPFAGPPGPGGPDGDRISPERRQRLMRLFATLSPEQQDQLLSRIEARLSEEGLIGGTKGKKAPRGGAGGVDKPAPKTEDVKVPDPDEMRNDNGKP